MRLNWATIDTCLLDMDGTILDLHYDHQVWHVELPRRLAVRDNLSYSEAKSRIAKITQMMKGTLNWYNLDFWKKNLNMDIDEIEIALSDFIALRSGAIEFLQHLKTKEVSLFLVTNAHPRGLERKLRKTEIGRFFHHIVSSHQLGFPKEDITFWKELNGTYNFDKRRAFLLDDNLAVLKTAKAFGIKHLYGIKRPNTEGEIHKSADFELIEDYSVLL